MMITLECSLQTGKILKVKEKSIQWRKIIDVQIENSKFMSYFCIYVEIIQNVQKEITLRETRYYLDKIFLNKRNKIYLCNRRSNIQSWFQKFDKFRFQKGP